MSVCNLFNTFDCEIDKVSETVKDRLNCQDDKVSKLDDKFSDLVQSTVASLKTEVKTIQHSVDSHSVDVSLCKSRLDVVDKIVTMYIVKTQKWVPVLWYLICKKSIISLWQPFQLEWNEIPQTPNIDDISDNQDDIVPDNGVDLIAVPNAQNDPVSDFEGNSSPVPVRTRRGRTIRPNTLLRDFITY